MRCLVILVAAFLAVSAEYLNYDGYRVYQIQLKNEDEIILVRLFTEHEDYDVWTPIRRDSKVVDVMVNPKSQTEFINFLRGYGIRFNVLLENVERVIKTQRLEQRMVPRLKNGQISFSKYLTNDEIQAYLQYLANTYSYVSLENIGRSFERRQLNVIKISKNPSANNPVIFIDGGIHAREWISPATVLYVINQLVENPSLSRLLEKVDWHIIPTINPDGYHYTHTSDRMWRKTRSKSHSHRCVGADPNRNFGFHWGGPGSGIVPCGETYRGEKAFSEYETRALRDYILKIKDDVKLYLTFHSYGNYLLYPWSYTTELPANARELNDLGKDVADAIRKVAGTVYQVGASAPLLYETAGSSDDYVKGTAGVELAYTIELPGKNSGFLLPPNEILGVVKETLEGVKKFHEYIENKFGKY